LNTKHEIMNMPIQGIPKREKPQLMSALERLGRNILLSNNSKREEYGFVWRHLSSCNKILDVGCGVGLFMEYAPDRIFGVDINPHNVEFCISNGFRRLLEMRLNLIFPTIHLIAYTHPM